MARNPSLRRRKRRFTGKSSQTTGAGLPLGTVSTFAFAAFSVILVASVFLAQVDTQTKLKNIRHIQTSANAENIADKLAHYISPYLISLQVYSKHPDIRAALQTGNTRDINQAIAKFKSSFDGALDLRLFKGIKTSVDDSVTPHISYACLDLFNTARSKRVSPLEIHASGTPQQHLDLVQAVMEEDGQVLGFMQLVLDVNLLAQWVKEVAGKDYVEVYQPIGNKRHVTIASAGNNENKSLGYFSTEFPVSGTGWLVQIWQPDGVSFFRFNSGMFAVMAIGLILAGVVVWLLRRSLSHAMAHDIENLVGHTIATLRGSKNHAYSLRMREFRRAAIRVEDMLANNGGERERDDDPSSINIRYDQAIPLDAATAMEDMMLVEELDSSEYAPDQYNQGGGQAQGAKQNESQQRIVAPIVNQADAPPLPPPEIFKAYDIRGIVGRTLTAQHATLIGRALGSEASKRGLDKIAFARDGRLSGPELGQALVQGILQTGVDVVDIGMVPTPVLYFAAAELTNGTGVMLTGSHNPPDYNGFKMVLGGETLASEAIQALRKRIESSDFATGKGQYEKAVIPERYISRITSDVKLKRKLRIAIDCGNGVAGKIAPQLYRALGCDVTELYCDVDGRFPNHHPDPSKPENLQDLIEVVKSKRFDVGLAFDGDGDRLGVVSPDGSIIWPDRLMILFAADVLSRNHGAQIIYDIKCSSNLTKAIWEKGGEPLMWKTGHSLIKAKMKASGALLAGEMSGHIFFKERWFGFDDGLYAGARLLEILSGDTRTPQQVFAGLPDAVNTPELNINMEEGEHHRFIETFMSRADFGDAQVTMIDGIRVDYEDAWGLIRASNTTPVLVLRFEGHSREAMKRVQDEFRKQIHALNPNLKLPF